jgi:hypothetical protein
MMRWKESWSVEKRTTKIIDVIKRRGWKAYSRKSSKSESTYITAIQGNKTLTIRVSDHMYYNGTQETILNICPQGHNISDVLQYLRDPSIQVRNIYYERKIMRKQLRNHGSTNSTET